MSSDGVGICLLGQDYGKYGDLAVVKLGGHSAAAISVGSDPDSPSHRYKADSEVPNEDALCIVESNELTAFAVADAHYGPEASHTLIRRLHEGLTQIVPRNLHELSHLLDTLQDGPPPATGSEATLLVVIYNRSTRSGFGISFGDSSFVVSGLNTENLPVNARNGRYVSTSPDQLPLEGGTFNFSASPGDVLLTYTDGIDECHYRSPATSVSPRHVGEIAANNSASAESVASKLGQLALAGVDGNPGGQDNIALIASLA